MIGQPFFNANSNDVMSPCLMIEPIHSKSRPGNSRYHAESSFKNVQLKNLKYSYLKWMTRFIFPIESLQIGMNFDALDQIMRRSTVLPSNQSGRANADCHVALDWLARFRLFLFAFFAFLFLSTRRLIKFRHQTTRFPQVFLFQRRRVLKTKSSYLFI